jgi:hypothetical protein
VARPRRTVTRIRRFCIYSLLGTGASGTFWQEATGERNGEA